MVLAGGRPLSEASTYSIVALLAFGMIIILGVIWFAIRGLLARRHAYRTVATVLDVHRHSASGEMDHLPRRLLTLTRSDWFPVVEFTGPDGRPRQVTLDAVKSRPAIGGTLPVLCDPDDPSRVTIRSFAGADGPGLSLALVLGLTFTIMATVVLLRRFPV